MISVPFRQAGAVVLAVFIVVSTVPGLAAAQSGVGGTIVIQEDETVSEVNAVSGAIIVHGTVTGDVNGAAGNVVITGTVNGDVNVATGDLRISGHVGGDVSTGAGRVYLEEGATVDGNFAAGAGEVRVDGVINGNAKIGAETIHLGESASIGGSLTYDGALEGNRDAVAGDVTRDRTIGPIAISEFQPLASWVTFVYAFIANLLFGALLIGLFPLFSVRIAGLIRTDPVRTGLIGLGMLVGVPLLLLVIAFTIIGIPFAIVGTLVFSLLVWIGLIYGRFALGMWLLSPEARERVGFSSDSDQEQPTRFDRKWVALVLGLFLGGLLALIPVIGELINLVILLLGLGALVSGLYGQRGRTDSAPSTHHPGNH